MYNLRKKLKSWNNIIIKIKDIPKNTFTKNVVPLWYNLLWKNKSKKKRKKRCTIVVQSTDEIENVVPLVYNLRKKKVALKPKSNKNVVPLRYNTLKMG